MKILKLAAIAFSVSIVATTAVVYVNLTQEKSVAETTLDMVEIMTFALDEGEGRDEGFSGWLWRRQLTEEECEVNFEINVGIMKYHTTLKGRKQICLSGGWRFCIVKCDDNVDTSGPA